ncbi:hypothetical protein ACGFI9_34555 [Micromonospora sp. NPDC048930]|uniref:hypothetical protein n=1 Tax=Micromonospora sp. NPDC048930 TaxID=3364261 RepID=UPI003722A559
MKLSRIWPGPGRALRASLIALVTTVTAVFAVSSPSMAGGEDFYFDCSNSWASCQTGVLVSAPGGLPCGTASTIYHSTGVCIRYDGDYVYVRDGQADGYAAMAFISSSGSSITYRICRNNQGYGTWVRCNFDWSESETKYVDGGYKKDYYDGYGQFLWSFSGN